MMKYVNMREKTHKKPYLFIFKSLIGLSFSSYTSSGIYAEDSLHKFDFRFNHSLQYRYALSPFHDREKKFHFNNRNNL